MAANPRALIESMMNNSRQALSKALDANSPFMRITGQQVIDAFMISGLSRAATGAVIGAGYGLLSGGSMFEGAKQGFVIGGAYGTYSHLNRQRALAARALFGMNADGPGGGFRAWAQIRNMERDDLMKMADEARQWWGKQLGTLDDIETAIRTSGTNKQALREQINRMREFGSAVAERAPSIEASERWQSSIQYRISELQRRLDEMR